MPARKPPIAAAIARREERFRTTFGRAGLGISIVDLTGRWLDANPAFCTLVGFSRAELLTKRFQEITHPDDLALNLENFERLAADEVSEYSMRKRFFHRDGHVVWADITVTLVRPWTDEPYMIAIVRDAGDEQQAQTQLRESIKNRTAELREIRRQRDAFFELSPEMFVICQVQDDTWWFKRVNPAFRNLLDLTEAEMLGRPMLDTVHPDDRARTLARLRSRSPAPDFENRYVGRDGSPHWISWRSSRSPGGVHYCVGRDVTASKEQAAREAVQRDQLEASNKLNALGRMAANISHEIKNPLTIVYGNACRLRMALPDLSPACRQMVSDIESMSMRIVKIVDGLRSFTREGAGDPRETVPLAKILEDTLSFCRARFALTGVEFECAPADPSIRLTCQPVQIQQVVLNLLNNAFEALEARPYESRRMGVRHRATDDTVSITVYDNGPGVDPAIRDRMFEPFFTTKQVGKGTGLGLNIARTIITSHRGRIYLDESATETAFVVELPRARD